MPNVRTKSVGTLTRIWDANPDSGLYFDLSQGYPRVAPPRNRIAVVEHFLGKSVPALVNARTDTQGSAAIQNALNGILRVTATATGTAAAHEVIDFNDLLQLDPSKRLVFEAGFSLSAVPGTGHRVLVGLADAHNADPDLITRSVWLSLAASADLKVESDDGTTDVSQDSTKNVAANTLYHARFEFINANDVRVYLKFQPL